LNYSDDRIYHIADLYRLVLALISGFYCLACLLFLRAFAVLLIEASMWISAGDGNGVEGGFKLGLALQQSAALGLALGDDINFDLLFRLV
jgi:hypothetical protein